MITYFMIREFIKSGEFDSKKNKYADFEILLRVPIFMLMDFIIIINLIKLI